MYRLLTTRQELRRLTLMLAIEVLLHDCRAYSSLEAADPAELEVLWVALEDQVPLGVVPDALAS